MFQNVPGVAVGFFEESVFFQRLDAHIGRREPDGASPVVSVGVEHFVIPRYGGPGEGAAEFVVLQGETDHCRGLLLRGNFRQHRPEGGRGQDMGCGKVAFADVVVATVAVIPIIGVDFFFQVFVFCLVFLLCVRVSGHPGQARDVEGGKGLLGDGVHPEEGHFPYARRVVHSALPTVPVIADALVFDADAVAADGEGELRVVVHRIEQVEMPLQEARFGEELFDMGLVAREFVIVALHPGEEGGIVGMLDADGGAGVLVEGVVEVVQRLDAREHFRSIFAEHDHKFRIPDPDGVVPESFVHIAGLHQSGLLLDVGFGLLPGRPVEIYIFRFFVKYRRGNAPRLFFPGASRHREKHPQNKNSKSLCHNVKIYICVLPLPRLAAIWARTLRYSSSL